MVARIPSSPGTRRSRRSNGSPSTFDVSACDENEVACNSTNRDGDVGYDAMAMTTASLAAYMAYATERLRNARRTSGRGGRTVPTSDSTMGDSTMANGRGGRMRSSAGDSMTTMCSGFAMRDGGTGSGRDGPCIPSSVSTVVSHGSTAADPDGSFISSQQAISPFSLATAKCSISPVISRRRGRSGGGRRSSKFAERKEGQKELHAESNRLREQANGRAQTRGNNSHNNAHEIGSNVHFHNSRFNSSETMQFSHAAAKGGASNTTTTFSSHSIPATSVGIGVGSQKGRTVAGRQATAPRSPATAMCSDTSTEIRRRDGSMTATDRRRSRSSGASETFLTPAIGNKNSQKLRTKLDGYGVGTGVSLWRDGAFSGSASRAGHGRSRSKSDDFSRQQVRLGRSEAELFKKSNTTSSFDEFHSPTKGNIDKVPMSPTRMLNESDANLTFCSPCSQQPSRNVREEAPLCQPCSPRADGSAMEDETRWELEESMGSLRRPSSKAMERMDNEPRNMSHASSNQNSGSPPVLSPAPRTRRPDPPPCDKSCNDARFMIRRTQSAPFDSSPSKPGKIFSPPPSPAARTPDRVTPPRHAGQGVSSGTQANRSLGQSQPSRRRPLISNSHVDSSTSPRGKGVEHMYATVQDLRRSSTIYVGDGPRTTRDGQRLRQHSGKYEIGQTLVDRAHSIKFTSDFQASILLTKLPLSSPIFVRRTSGEWTYARLAGRLSDGRGETSLVVILDARGDMKKVLERFWWKKCLRLVNQHAVDGSASGTVASFSNASRTSTNVSLIRKGLTPEPGRRSSSSDDSDRFSHADIINSTTVAASERSRYRTKSAPGLVAMPSEPAGLFSGIVATSDDASSGSGPSPAPNWTTCEGGISSRGAAANNTNNGAFCNSDLQSYSVPAKGGANEATTSTTGTKAASKPTRDQPGEISPDTVMVNLHARHCTSRRDRMRPMRRGSSGNSLLSLGSLGGDCGDGGGGDRPASFNTSGGGGGDDAVSDDATCAPAVDSRSSFDASSDSTERTPAPPPPPPYGSGSSGSSSGDSAGRGSSALGGAARMRLRGVDP